jgi:hypothetical protein
VADNIYKYLPAYWRLAAAISIGDNYCYQNINMGINAP